MKGFCKVEEKFVNSEAKLGKRCWVTLKEYWVV